MVQEDEQHVAAAAQVEQSHPDGRFRGEVEHVPGSRTQALIEARGTHLAHLDGDPHHAGVQDQLVGLAIDRPEHGAQDLMAPHQVV